MNSARACLVALNDVKVLGLEQEGIAAVDPAAEVCGSSGKDLL
jgi:hypothetical protein